MNFFLQLILSKELKGLWKQSKSGVLFQEFYQLEITIQRHQGANQWGFEFHNGSEGLWVLSCVLSIIEKSNYVQESVSAECTL